MRLTISILTLAIGLASCSGSNKVTTAKEGGKSIERKKMACGKVHVDMNEPHLDWFEENNSILSKADEILVLPKDYKVYTIESAQLNNFFSAIQNGKTLSTVIPLPEPADCQIFTVKNNLKEGSRIPAGTTMGAGESNGQKMAISYYMGKLAANINWFDLQYEVTTVLIKGTPYILVYEKQLPPPGKTKSTNQEVTKPEFIEIQYNK